MATLWKRATPSQFMMLRMVKGAVLCTQDHHGMVRDERLASSIAKRAVGYLTSQRTAVLTADSSPRQKGLRESVQTRRPRASDVDGEGSKGDRHSSSRRSPLRDTWKLISASMISVKKSGDIAEFEARVRLLKLLNQVQLELEDFNERNNNDRHP